MNAVKYIVVYGDPIDGFNFRGPFDTMDEAIEYGDSDSENTWWVTELTPPYEEISEQPKPPNEVSEKTA